LLEAAKDYEPLRENSAELLRCLSWTTGSVDYSGNVEENKKVLLIPGVAKALWAATTAQRIWYRFQERLITTRNACIRAGINSDELPLPEWLLERAGELEASQANPAANREKEA
jgi:hypothetical protein